MTEVRWENLRPRAMEQYMNEYPVVTTVVPQSGKRKTIEICLCSLRSVVYFVNHL